MDGRWKIREMAVTFSWPRAQTWSAGELLAELGELSALPPVSHSGLLPTISGAAESFAAGFGRLRTSFGSVKSMDEPMVDVISDDALLIVWHATANPVAPKAAVAFASTCHHFHDVLNANVHKLKESHELARLGGAVRPPVQSEAGVGSAQTAAADALLWSARQLEHVDDRLSGMALQASLSLCGRRFSLV